MVIFKILRFQFMFLIYFMAYSKWYRYQISVSSVKMLKMCRNEIGSLYPRFLYYSHWFPFILIYFHFFHLFIFVSIYFFIYLNLFISICFHLFPYVFIYFHFFNIILLIFICFHPLPSPNISINLLIFIYFHPHL